MPSPRNPWSTLFTAAQLTLASAAYGCEDEETPRRTGSEDSGVEQEADASERDAAPEAPETPEADGGGTTDAGDPARVYAYVRYADDSVFVNLADSSDVAADAPELDVKKARELMSEPLFAGKNVIDQNGFELRQRLVSDDLQWSDGPTVSFSQYPFGEDGLSTFFMWKVNPHAIYFNYDVTSRVVFDPTDFKIIASKDDSKIPLTLDGLPLEAAGNRSALESGDQPTQIAYFWKDEDWWKFAPKSIIAQYDQKTHDEIALTEIDCPGLAVGTRDEEGNTYWGTWDYKATAFLFDQGKEPCIARIKPDGKLDEDFTTNGLEWTGGKYGKKFQYVRDGWGLYMVFDHEKSGLDFDKPTNDTDNNPIARWWDTSNWQVYKVDLKTKKAEVYAPFKDMQLWDIHVQKVDAETVYYFITYTDGYDSSKDSDANWENAKEAVYVLRADNSVSKHSEAGDGKGTWARVR